MLQVDSAGPIHVFFCPVRRKETYAHDRLVVTNTIAHTHAALICEMCPAMAGPSTVSHSCRAEQSAAGQRRQMTVVPPAPAVCTIDHKKIDPIFTQNTLYAEKYVDSTMVINRRARQIRLGKY